MRTLEVRRHSWTKKGIERASGSLLTAEGVSRARQVGDELPVISHVITGPDRRHIETAIAMGYAVDEIVDPPSCYVEGVVAHHDQWTWERPFERYAELVQTHQLLRDVAETHLRHWLHAVSEMAPGERALVISSGGSIEPALVVACPNGDHASWGGALHQLQGATLTFDDDGRCLGVEIRR